MYTVALFEKPSSGSVPQNGEIRAYSRSRNHPPSRPHAQSSGPVPFTAGFFFFFFWSALATRLPNPGYSTLGLGYENSLLRVRAEIVSIHPRDAASRRKGREFLSTNEPKCSR